MEVKVRRTGGGRGERSISRVPNEAVPRRYGAVLPDLVQLYQIWYISNYVGTLVLHCREDNKFGTI